MCNLKKIFLVFLAVTMIAAAMPAAFAAEASAIPSETTIMLDGEETKLQAYEINGCNYYKLRDLAALLNGTDKRFGVSWEEETDTVVMTAGEAYEPIGGEMELTRGLISVQARSTGSKIMLDGRMLAMTVYMIRDCNYFRLRDVMAVLDVGVEWDEETKTIILDTSVGYSEPWTMAEKTEPLTSVQVAEKAESVVMIKTYDEEGEERGLASGFFITPDGWLATCYHAVEDSYSIKVICDDGTEYPVSAVIAYNKEYDTALIKVDGDREFPALEFSPSAELARGERVYAIGSPQGEQSTISDGLVSTITRDAKGLRCPDANDIQVSVPISKGSSGCPLLDGYGHVVGIIYATHNFGQNMNYAIRTDEFFMLFDNIENISVEEFYDLTHVEETDEEIELDDASLIY